MLVTAPSPKAVTVLRTESDMGTTGPQAPVDFFLRPIADITLKNDFLEHDQQPMQKVHPTNKMASERDEATDSWLPGVFVSNSSTFNVEPFVHDSWWKDDVIPFQATSHNPTAGNGTSWSSTTTPRDNSQQIGK